MRRDKHVMMMELVKLRQQQQDTRACLHAMEQRIKGTELKQKQMMSFLAKAMKNPGFIQKLVQRGGTKELEAALNKKRRLIDQAPEEGTSVKIEPLEYGNISEFEVSELDKLAMEMQGLTNTGKNPENEEIERKEMKLESGNKALDVGILEEYFLNEEFQGDMGLLDNVEGEDEEDVNVLVEQLTDLVSSPK